MPYRKLLLPVIGTEAGEAAITTAFVAARIWRAHVHGLHVRIGCLRMRQGDAGQAQQGRGKRLQTLHPGYLQAGDHI